MDGASPSRGPQRLCWAPTLGRAARGGEEALCVEPEPPGNSSLLPRAGASERQRAAGPLSSSHKSRPTAPPATRAATAARGGGPASARPGAPAGARGDPGRGRAGGGGLAHCVLGRTGSRPGISADLSAFLHACPRPGARGLLGNCLLSAGSTPVPSPIKLFISL